TLDRQRRELRADGQPVAMGERAFDTLLALVDARGIVLSKDDLMRRIWPDRVVEENNLEAQISALRKVFGADRMLIRTVPTRGFQFPGDVRPTRRDSSTASVHLPVMVSELVGRESDIGEVMTLVRAHRLVTLTGVGGIGKTRLGLEVARRLGPN